MKVFTMLTCVNVLTIAGCGGNAQSEPLAASPSRDELRSAWQSSPLPANPQPTAVKQGAAPLVYRVESGATIRVHDATSKLDLVSGYVPAGSLVRVDAKRGVIFGGETVVEGPLGEGGRYVVFVEPSGDNVARQGVIRPRPRNAR